MNISYYPTISHYYFIFQRCPIKPRTIKHNKTIPLHLRLNTTTNLGLVGDATYATAYLGPLININHKGC